MIMVATKPLIDPNSRFMLWFTDYVYSAWIYIEEIVLGHPNYTLQCCHVYQIYQQIILTFHERFLYFFA